MKANPLVWFEIYVNDLQRAQKFYETVLETKLSDLPTPESEKGNLEMLSFPMSMEGAGASGALVKMKGFETGRSGTIVYFRSDDCAIEESRIVKAGGKIFKPKQSLDDFGFMVIAYDSEGNLFGVHSMK